MIAVVTVEQIASLMGGRKVFGKPISEMRVFERIQQGLPLVAMETLLSSSPLTMAEIERIGLPRRTVSHRRKMGHFSADQSDSLFRLARVYSTAPRAWGLNSEASRNRASS